MSDLDPPVLTRVAPASTVVESSSEPVDQAEWESLVRAAPPGSVITVIRIVVPTASATVPPAGGDLDMKYWYTPAEVAARYRMQTRTIRTWVNEGRFPGHRRLPNGAIRIPVKDVDAVMARTNAASTSLAGMRMAPFGSRRCPGNRPSFTHVRIVRVCMR